jgi:hypothetical protein
MGYLYHTVRFIANLTQLEYLLGLTQYTHYAQPKQIFNLTMKGLM